jgi:hypothetical protein
MQAFHFSKGPPLFSFFPDTQQVSGRYSPDIKGTVEKRLMVIFTQWKSTVLGLYPTHKTLKKNIESQTRKLGKDISVVRASPTVLTM